MSHLFKSERVLYQPGVHCAFFKDISVKYNGKGIEIKEAHFNNNFVLKDVGPLYSNVRLYFQLN